MTQALNPALLQLGNAGVGDELKDAIADAIVNHPRSLQSAIGPSEVGSPCGRRIAYKLLGLPERSQAPNWLATIGTAVHAWLEGVLDNDNIKRAALLEGQERWYVETKLTVGYVPGIGFITGSCDVYDRVTGTVIDWKVVGPTQLKKYRSQGASTQYKVQANLYGQGWVNAGLPVSRVMIIFLPRNASLEEAYIWSEDFDPAVAKATLDRLAKIQQTITEHGTGALELLATADSYCGHCSWYRPNSTDLAQGCPGDPASQSFHTQPALTLGTAPTAKAS